MKLLGVVALSLVTLASSARAEPPKAKITYPGTDRAPVREDDDPPRARADGGRSMRIAGVALCITGVPFAALGVLTTGWGFDEGPESRRAAEKRTSNILFGTSLTLIAGIGLPMIIWGSVWAHNARKRRHDWEPDAVSPASAMARWTF